MSHLNDLLKNDGASIDADDDFETINALYLERGWTDGLPIVPPTEARVEKMLAYCDRPWDEPIAKIPPRWGEATPLRLAANAVMAGCRPEYFPLFMLAIEAMCEEPFNLYGIQATTHMCAPLVIVNGPVIKELGINGGHNAFGPGTQSNATIGRAVNLALLNVCRSVPGHADLACLSSPAEFSYCMGEDATLSPWPLMHEEQYDPRATMVLVLKAEAPHAVMDLASTRAAGLLETIIDCCTTLGSNNAYAPGCLVLMLNPDHARLLLDSGYDKHRLRNEIHASAGISRAQVSRRGLAGIGPKDGAAGLHKVTRSPEDVEIVVAGGKGGHSAVILPWALNSDPVYAAIRLPDGNFAKSLEQFRWRT